MNLYEVIKKDQLNARKTKNKVLSSLLSVMLSEADSKFISRLPENEQHDLILKIVQSTEKQLLKNIKTFKGKMDISNYEEELNLLQVYLPKKLSSEETLEIMKENCLFCTMPQVMKYFSENYKGLFDPSVIKYHFETFNLTEFNGNKIDE